MNDDRKRIEEIRSTEALHDHGTPSASKMCEAISFLLGHIDKLEAALRSIEWTTHYEEDETGIVPKDYCKASRKLVNEALGETDCKFSKGQK